MLLGSSWWSDVIAFISIAGVVAREQIFWKMGVKFQVGGIFRGHSDSKYFSRVLPFSRYFCKNSGIFRVDLDQLYQDWSKILFKMLNLGIIFYIAVACRRPCDAHFPTMSIFRRSQVFFRGTVIIFSNSWPLMQSHPPWFLQPMFGHHSKTLRPIGVVGLIWSLFPNIVPWLNVIGKYPLNKWCRCP